MANKHDTRSSGTGRGGSGGARSGPGTEADQPTQVPPAGWRQVLTRAWKGAKEDHVPLLSAGVAFFAFLSIFPALIALLSVYGLVASPQEAAQQVQSFATALPQGAQQLISSQVTSVAESSGGALTLGLVVSLAGALWSASGGVMNLIKATNVAYDEDETRGFIKLRGTALLLTFGAIVFVLITLALVTVVPIAFDVLGLGSIAVVGGQIIRWLALVLLVIAGLAVVYRIAPDRAAPRLSWASLGAVVATLLWVAGSVAFSFYIDNFGSYNQTYGTLTGVIVLMLWLYLTCYVVLLGAEINAESERQTARDTTNGEPYPMAERGAQAADTLPDRRKR